MSEVYTFTATVSTTELSITGGTSTIQTRTTEGSYVVALDMSALAANDVFEFRVLEKCLSGGSQLVFDYATISTQGATDAAGWMSVPYRLKHGWDFTLKKQAGTDRSISASVRKLD